MSIEAKIEQWKLDGKTLVTTLGASRRADGSADYGSRWMLQKTATGWDLVLVERSRLTVVDGSLTDTGFAALVAYALPDIGAAVRNERERIALLEANRIRNI